MMENSKLIFAVYAFLAVFCAGNMTVLQLQHFVLYPKVSKEGFKEYLQANNKAAVIPSIMPAILLFVTTIILIFHRPSFMPAKFVIISFALNIINLISTILWQGRLHGQLANIGYNKDLVHLLIKTNWIRTIALLIQGLIALYCAISAIK